MRFNVTYKDYGAIEVAERHISDVVVSNHHHYHDHEGKIEELERKLDSMSRVVERLIGVIWNNHQLNAYDIGTILNEDVHGVTKSEE